MKMKILIGILLFLIVVNLATIGSYLYIKWRQGNEPVPNGPPLPRRAQMLMDKLSDDQRQKLREMMHQFDQETRDQKEQAAQIERKTFDLLHHDPVPTDSINANLAEISRLRLEMSKAAVEHLVQAKSFLSPEQRELFFGAIMQGRQGPPPGGPPGGRRPFGGGPPGMRGGDDRGFGPPDDQPEHDGPPPDRN